METFVYQKEVMKDARFHFDRIFSFAPRSLSELKQIKILVIGAGSFPSFVPLLHSITHACPKANEINFTLIEPDQSATNRFKDKLTKAVDNKFNARAHVCIHNADIKSYLKNTYDIFDLIYFEHPDVSIVNVLLEKIRLVRSTLATSMQESIPYLRRIVKDQSVIIASFILKDDLCEVKPLLKFSLAIKMHFVRKKIFSDGRYYCFGLIGIVNESQLPNKTPKKLAKEIRLGTILFGIFLLASAIIFFITPNKLKTVSFLFFIGQLFYNHYGVRGLIMKLILIIGQTAILIMSHPAA